MNRDIRRAFKASIADERRELARDLRLLRAAARRGDRAAQRALWCMAAAKRAIRDYPRP
jgi:hypothetical protein